MSLLVERTFLVLFLYHYRTSHVLCEHTLEIETPLGKLQGREELFGYSGQLLDVFNGVPYAKSPTVTGRFKKSEPIDRFTENNSTYLATWYKPGCIQPEGLFGIYESTVFSEDCLYLNIWRRSGTNSSDRKPVILIIHGGGYTAGDGHEYDFRGTQLAAFGDVIAVNVNYRLGLFGFLDLGLPEAPGNVGHMDQTLAMRWIQDYIKYFGGDRKRVTLMGVSAGGFSISSHLISTFSKNLFHAAIIDGGVITLAKTDSRAEQRIGLLKIAKALNCSGGMDEPNLLKCFLSTSASDLLEQQQLHSLLKIYTPPTHGNEFIKNIPEKLVNHRSEDFTRVPLIIGDCSNEGSIIFYPDLEKETLSSVEETLNYIKDYLGDHPILRNFKPEEVIRDYNISEGGHPEYYRNITLSFAGDGFFVCPVRNFANRYSAVAPTYFYYWDRLTQQKVSLDPLTWGAFHGTPFFHMIGSQFTYFENSTICPLDANYVQKSIKMVTDFAANPYEEVRFGDIIWPAYHENERNVFVFGREKDFVTKSHPRGIYCETVWKGYENI